MRPCSAAARSRAGRRRRPRGPEQSKPAGVGPAPDVRHAEVAGGDRGRVGMPCGKRGGGSDGHRSRGGRGRTRVCRCGIGGSRRHRSRRCGRRRPGGARPRCGFGLSLLAREARTRLGREPCLLGALGRLDPGDLALDRRRSRRRVANELSIWARLAERSASVARCSALASKSRVVRGESFLQGVRLSGDPPVLRRHLRHGVEPVDQVADFEAPRITSTMSGSPAT